MDSNTRIFKEAKYGICFDKKRKILTLTPSKKSEINTKGSPCGLHFGFSSKNKLLISKILLSRTDWILISLPSELPVHKCRKVFFLDNNKRIKKN